MLQVMIQILKDMGITEYEPRVINQMLEFTYSGFPAVFSFLGWCACTGLDWLLLLLLFRLQDTWRPSLRMPRSTQLMPRSQQWTQTTSNWPSSVAWISPSPHRRHAMYAIVIISISYSDKLTWVFVCRLIMWICMCSATVFAGGGPTEEPDPAAVNQTLHRPPPSARSLLPDGPQLQAEDCAEKGEDPALAWLFLCYCSLLISTQRLRPGLFVCQQDIRSSPQRRGRLQQTQHTHFRWAAWVRKLCQRPCCFW